MSQLSSFQTQINPRQFAIYALAGAAVAFGVISFFLFSVNSPDPSWPANWRARPLLVTPLAGAAGGAFLYFVTRFKGASRTVRSGLMVFGILSFVIALWIGVVLGLDGTMWN